MTQMIAFKTGRSVPATSGLHAVGICSEALDDRSEHLDWGVLDGRGFKAEAGQVELLSGTNGTPVAVVGLGSESDVTPAVVRKAAASLAGAARRVRRVAVSLLDAVPDSRVERLEALQALAEGMTLGAYSYGEYKSKPKPNELRSVTVVGPGGRKVTEALARGRRVAEAVCLARDLVNEPGGSLTPVRFAEIATEVAEREGLQVTVLDEDAIRDAALGGLLGVNRGSTQPPRFVELRYRPDGDTNGSVALVGKGITFDAGGLSIKTTTGMMTMKCDMSGAAAVLAAMSALPAINPPVEVTGYIPLTDNMLGGDATRPGDVLTLANGKTVEVLNTDAEGRLVLADALSLACREKPDAVVDLATLTGACMVALGPDMAGLMSNNEAWETQLVSAAERTGEQVWRLPLPAAYRKQLDSSVADIKNIGGPYGGALTAGLFLQEFVSDGVAWAHLDIAGPSFTEQESAENSKGGTGFGVRLLLDALECFQPPDDGS